MMNSDELCEELLFTRKQIYKLLWPLIVEQLLTVFVGMVDVLMVAAVGETAVSGVSLVDAINNLIIQVLFAITAGGTIVCARFYGADDLNNAGRTAAQTLLSAISMTTAVTLIFLIGGNTLLGLIFGTVESSVMSNAATYMFITSLSFPFLAAYQTGAAMFRAQGRTKVSMLVSLLMNTVNIIGNAICIFGLKMGVAGVAIPTLIARALAAVIILRLLQNSEGRIASLSWFRPSGEIIRNIMSIGIPNGIESGLFQFGKLMLQSLVSTLGTASIAAYAVASNLVTYLYLPGNALGAGMLTIVGQCLGAGKREQARDYAKMLIAINYGLLAVICTIMIVCRGFFVSCYMLSLEAAELAKGLVLIHSIAMIIWPLGFLFPHYFRATGRAAFTMGIAIFSMWTFRIGLAYVFIKVLHMNVLGAWYAMFVDWIFRTVVYVTAFRRDGKRVKPE